MSGFDNEDINLDERPRNAIDYHEVSKELDRRIAEVEQRAAGRSIPDEVIDEIVLAKYASNVLHYGNAGGEQNPTITLPQPWRTLDIIAIIGRPEYYEPGSDEAWRRIKRRYDARNGATISSLTRSR